MRQIKNFVLLLNVEIGNKNNQFAKFKFLVTTIFHSNFWFTFQFRIWMMKVWYCVEQHFPKSIEVSKLLQCCCCLFPSESFACCRLRRCSRCRFRSSASPGFANPTISSRLSFNGWGRLSRNFTKIFLKCGVIQNSQNWGHCLFWQALPNVG